METEKKLAAVKLDGETFTRIHHGDWFQPDKIISKLKELFPILVWLPNYRKEDLSKDIIAGLVIGCLVIPQVIGYSQLAGVTSDIGLKTAMMGMYVYPFLGTSRHVTMGLSAVGGIVIGNILNGSKLVSDSTTQDEYNLYANTLAFSTGVIFILMGFFGFGFIASFLGFPVITGFTAGAAITIASSQLSVILGVKNHNDTFIDNCYSFGKIGDTVVSSVIFWLAGSILMIACKYVPMYYPSSKIQWLQKLPMPLILVIGGSIVTYIIKSNSNIKIITVGRIDVQSLNKIQIDINLIGKDPSTFILEAFIYCIIMYAKHISICLHYAMKRSYVVIPSQEIYSHGGISLFGILFGIVPINNVLTHAALADQYNCKTPLFCWISGFMAMLTLILLKYVPNLLLYLPQSILSSVITTVCISMFPVEKN